MTSTDKDFRFMATNDLMTELQKDSIKLDDDSERKVRIKFVVSFSLKDDTEQQPQIVTSHFESLKSTVSDVLAVGLYTGY
jgi:hypothetical protein